MTRRTSRRAGRGAPPDPITRQADEMRIVRTASGVSFATLAEAVGTSATTLKRLEKGDPKVAHGTVLAVREWLGLPTTFAPDPDVPSSLDLMF